MHMTAVCMRYKRVCVCVRVCLCAPVHVHVCTRLRVRSIRKAVLANACQRSLYARACMPWVLRATLGEQFYLPTFVDQNILKVVLCL